MKLPIECLWTVEETARYLRVPKATLYQWRYLGIGPKAGRVGGIFAMTRPMSSPGSDSSKRPHERLRPLA